MLFYRADSINLDRRAITVLAVSSGKKLQVATSNLTATATHDRKLPWRSRNQDPAKGFTVVVTNGFLIAVRDLVGGASTVALTNCHPLSGNRRRGLYCTTRM